MSSKKQTTAPKAAAQTPAPKGKQSNIPVEPAAKPKTKTAMQTELKEAQAQLAEIKVRKQEYKDNKQRIPDELEKAAWTLRRQIRGLYRELGLEDRIRTRQGTKKEEDENEPVSAPKASPKKSTPANKAANKATASKAAPAPAATDEEDGEGDDF